MSKQLTVVFVSTNFNKDELNAVKMYCLLLANVLILTNDECILVSVLQMLYIYISENSFYGVSWYAFSFC